jgi:hypothetical protein
MRFILFPVKNAVEIQLIAIRAEKFVLRLPKSNFGFNHDLFQHISHSVKPPERNIAYGIIEFIITQASHFVHKKNIIKPTSFVTFSLLSTVIYQTDARF